MSVVSVVCGQVEFSAKSRALVQRSHNECGASECDREDWTMFSPWVY